VKALLLTIGALTAALSLTVGLGSASAASKAGPKVGVASSTLGRILVDGRGHTLYMFSTDAHGKSACAGQCAAFWPPLIASGKPVAAAGAKASLLGTILRSDGRLQVTYAHHPLYSFVKDTRKGQTNGEGLEVFGGKWWALSSTGAKIAMPASVGTGTDPGSGTYGGGYGY